MGESSRHSRILTAISISAGEESNSNEDEDEFTPIDSARVHPKKKYSILSVCSSMSLPLSPLFLEDTCPSLPPRRLEMFPEELSVDSSLPPQRVTSLRRLMPPRDSSYPSHGTGISEELTACQEYPKAKIILIGESGTGKTSLVIKLATGMFEPMCSPTIGEITFNQN